MKLKMLILRDSAANTVLKPGEKWIPPAFPRLPHLALAYCLGSGHCRSANRRFGLRVPYIRRGYKHVFEALMSMHNVDDDLCPMLRRRRTFIADHFPTIIHPTDE